MTATVHLGADRVGTLEPNETGGAAFRFDPAYLGRPDRPLLGRHFEELELAADRDFFSPGGQLHAFFRNALPEGALRKWVQEQLGRGQDGEYAMLVQLGEDLPGALRVVEGLDATETSLSRPEPSAPASPTKVGVRFSLAGIQLKASVIAGDDRVTLPLRDEAGDWIAKFPSARHDALPENEFSVLRWARRVGLDVPEHRLFPVDEIQNLPSGFPREGRALLVRRFDRAAGARIHQEDFAQIFNLQPEEKYVAGGLPDFVHYGAIAAIVARHAGEADLEEALRRLVFSVLCGNADAHCKNWAFIYRDRRRARLSPLYDVVATVAYEGMDSDLPLLWLPSNDPWHAPPTPLAAIGADHIGAMARFLGLDERTWVDSLRGFASDARRTWDALVDEGEVPDFVVQAVRAHLALVSL